MSRKNSRRNASPAIVAEIAADPVAPPAPSRTPYAAVLAALAALDPATLIPIGANHNPVRNASGIVPGIPTRYLYATPSGVPVPPDHAAHPTADASITLALTLLGAASAIPDHGITTHPALVASCGIRYAGSVPHAATRAAGDVDAADFAVGFAARVVDSLPRNAIPAACHAATARLSRRGIRATRHDRIDFARTLLLAARSALNP